MAWPVLAITLRWVFVPLMLIQTIAHFRLNRNNPKQALFVPVYSWLLVLVFAGVSGCAGDSESTEDVTHDPSGGTGEQTEPWTQEELMDPADLAEILEDSARENPVILDIGGVGHIMGGRIKGSEVIGPTSESENLAELKATVAAYPKDVDLVIYCGCCPFEDCPNIRPAFQLLKEKGLTNPKLLDIQENLRVHWVNLGYPIEEES